MYFDESPQYSPLIVRLGLGSVMLIHGIGKAFNVGPSATGVAGFSDVLASLGVPAPLLFAWIVTLVELLGGACVLLGLFTRGASALIACDVFTALLLVHLPNGFAVSNGGFEFVMLLFFAAVSLAVGGPGVAALDLAREERGLVFPLPT